MQFRTKAAAVVGAAGIGVSAFLVGTSSASIPDADGNVYACYDAKGNTRIIDEASDNCLTGETSIDWPSESGAFTTYIRSSYTQNTSTTQEVDCLSGDRLISASGFLPSGSGESRIQSYQTDGSGQPTGATFKRGSGDTLTVFAICMDD